MRTLLRILAPLLLCSACAGSLETARDSSRHFGAALPDPSPHCQGLDRDRAVDETGGQIAVFGRLGSRPFTRPEMERLFLNRKGVPFKVSDEVDMSVWRPALAKAGLR